MDDSSPARAQAAYYAVTGLWPIVAYRAFEAVTGRKREPWLVKTVGLLLAAVAFALAAGPAGRSPATRRLRIGSALALGGVDLWYAGVRRQIRPIYLLDALAEAVLLLAWLRSEPRLISDG